MISVLDVLLTETTLVTKANPGPGRIWDRYRRGPRTGRILDWSNHGAPHRIRIHIRYSLKDIIKTGKRYEIICCNSYRVCCCRCLTFVYVFIQPSRTAKLHSKLRLVFAAVNQMLRLIY